MELVDINKQETFIKGCLILSNMVVVHRRGEGRTPTGGRTTILRGKRRHEVGNHPTETRVDNATKVVVDHVKFGSIKSRVLTANQANVFDPKSKTFSQSKIKSTGWTIQLFDLPFI